MIIEYIRYKLRRGSDFTRDRTKEEFEAAYRAAAAYLDACPHCLSYELSRCKEEPTQYILRIEWDPLEAHLSGFRRSQHFAPS